jgi:hypothetical protein
MDMPKSVERQTDMCNGYFQKDGHTVRSFVSCSIYYKHIQPSPWHATVKVQAGRKLGLTLRYVGDRPFQCADLDTFRYNLLGSYAISYFVVVYETR